MTSSNSAQRIAARIQPKANRRHNTVITVGRYSPTSQSLIMVSNPSADPDTTRAQQPKERLHHAAASTPNEPRTIVQVNIVRKALIGLLCTTTIPCMPIGAVIAATFRPGITPELFIWTIYAAITGAIIGVAAIIYIRKTLLHSGLSMLAILPDFQDQQHFNSKAAEFSDAQLSVNVEPCVMAGNANSSKHRRQRR